MLLRLTHLTAAHLFAALRLLRTSDHDKVAEILALRHQLAVLERQLGSSKVKFSPTDRVVLATLLAPLPRAVLTAADHRHLIRLPPLPGRAHSSPWTSSRPSP
ncbi:hypothetical protein ACFRU3_14070 [Streptomyces sp. NPDC056910]|uniref:hypothetical protein n=1 Tax=Streptomyces sp. NPDC056910 TaxID=3345964 RepID=UPI00369F4E0A